MKVVYQHEQSFKEITDEDGYPCDDISAIENWMHSAIRDISLGGEFNIKAINFATYGASLAYLDNSGKILTPVYNYLKPMPPEVMEGFYERYGGVEEFSRKTASPALGMLNSGLQIHWLRKIRPEVFSKVSKVLHFPQYLSYCFTVKAVSEYTSIGCHTAMWDFDNMKYHPWLADEKITLPEPVSNSQVETVQVNNTKILAGVGIHDSSSSLVPYFSASSDPFILISTGTWCIFMNPFNSEPLTAEELRKDSLCYLSVQQKQVKSSRLFLGHIHQVNTEKIATFFGKGNDFYKKVKADPALILILQKKDKVFFKNGVPENYIDINVDYGEFFTIEEAYHQLIIDLVRLAMEALKLVIPEHDNTRSIFISGGFARNEIFVRLMATSLKDKQIFTSQMDNATALGAALVIWEKAFGNVAPVADLGLKEVKPFS
ncbi:MAG: carbohydrate kinase [Bacteroidales bacterium]|nr:carbohydrate kinase [Bacteroidales bacterium]